MKRIWIISALTIALSVFLIRATDQTNHYTIQDNFDSDLTTGVFDNREVTVPSTLAQLLPPPRRVLGETTGEKEIQVDLTNQRLYAYEGDSLVYSFLVSTGKWGRTPTGTFHIANKFRFVGMSGGSAALHTYYNLPNVPYTMFYGNAQIPASRGFSFHGTYWHNNFGIPMSHGCINMKTSEAGLLYNWADPQLPEGKTSGAASKNNPGTRVVVFGVTPKS
jgi:lipoprotein-anchoring transpeptidase ErfK/SrfK